jgi:hypothetical protein
MTKFCIFFKKFGKKLIDNSANQKISMNFIRWKNLSKIKNIYNHQRKICIFCNRLVFENEDNYGKIQLDYHLSDHFMVEDLPNFIPIKSYECTTELEVFIHSLHLEKNYKIWENFSLYFLGKNILSYQFFYQLNNERKNREYVFLKYRIAKLCRREKIKKLKWKGILHGWNGIKEPKENFISQRGEFLIGLPEKFSKIKKKKALRETDKMFFKKSIFFFRFFNKKTYDFELFKRLFCSKFSNFVLRVLFIINFKEAETLNYLNSFEYLTSIFFHTNWKCPNIESNFFLRLDFFGNLFYASENKKNHLFFFIRYFIKDNKYRIKKEPGKRLKF